jgi:uncharacterized membrane protein
MGENSVPEERKEKMATTPPNESITRKIEFSAKETEDGKIMAVLAYVLFLVPLLAARENKFVMYHTEQGILLAILWVANAVISTIFMVFCIGPFIFLIISLALLVFHVIGILKALNGEAKPLPFFGQFGEKLNLVK